MPRKTKESTKEDLNKKNVDKKTSKKSAKVSQAKDKAIKSVKPTKTVSKAKSTTTKKRSSSAKTKTTAKDKNTSTTKKSTSSKKAVIKSSSSKKTNRTKSAKSTKTSSKTSSSKNNKTVFSPEYYDLPFRYNQTVVKILAQTPTTLFIYWEISDSDRENLKNQYGKYFFEITKPVLIVYNESLNYAFTVDIDDFANSWYLHVRDSASKYKIELGRIPIPINYDYIPNYDLSKHDPIEPIRSPYIYISSSNELDSPNDKILYNKLDKIYFRNIKTNQLIEKDVSDFPNIYKNGKFINIYEIYSSLYRNEISTNSFNLYNPSSGNLSSGSFPSRFK